MTKTVLITGGAGFIATHLTRALHGRVEKIVLLDNLLPQIHQGSDAFTAELRSLAECVVGDVRDPAAWKGLAADHPDIEVVIHLAALTGTGQSMYAIREYDSVNCGGTATMLECLLDRRDNGPGFPRLRHVVLASSRAVYGEGAYRCPADPPGIFRYPPQRTADQLARKMWNPACPACGEAMLAVPTSEDAPQQPTSFYGVTKLVQEQYVKTMMSAAQLTATTLRFQNVFGPGQSLKNPYTGVIGVFYSNIVGGRPIDIYEDGEISRDFIYISDVVEAIVRAAVDSVPGTFNVGTGQFTRLASIANWLCDALGKTVPIGCKGAFRVGDIRQNAADTTLARSVLRFEAAVSVQQGLHRYVDWARTETPLDEAAITNAAMALQAAGLAQT